MTATPPGTGTEVPMDFETALSVDAVEEAARELAGEGPSREDLEALCQGEPAVDIRGLHAGYGRMEILHGIDLVAGKGQSLCLIGPNGAGKSTVLHSAFGFADVMAGSIHVGGRDVTRLASRAGPSIRKSTGRSGVFWRPGARRPAGPWSGRQRATTPWVRPRPSAATSWRLWTCC